MLQINVCSNVALIPMKNARIPDSISKTMTRTPTYLPALFLGSMAPG